MSDNQGHKHRTKLNKYAMGILVFHVFIFNQCVAKDKAGVENTLPMRQLYIEAYSDQVHAEIRINDIPVGFLIPGNKFFPKNIELNILHGNNTLSILPIDRKGAINVRLASYAIGEFVDGKGGETLLEVKSENGVEETRHVELSYNHLKWTWLETDLVSDKNSYAQAIEFAKSFYKSLADGNVNEIIPALKPLFIDKANLNPSITVKEREDEITKDIQEYIKDKEFWKYDPIESINIKPVLVANGHLIDLRRSDNSPLMRTFHNDKFDGFRLFNMIGRKNGVWQFYR